MKLLRATDSLEGTRMSTMERIGAKVVLLAALLAGVVSCGGTGSNNDQGTSFLAFGYFADSTGETGETGTLIPLFQDLPVGGFDGLTHITFIGLQNRLTNQFIRVVRVDCSYSIEGSNLAIPDDSDNFSTVIGPSAGEDGGEVDPTLGNVSYAGFEIISPDLFSYLNNNQSRLPQLPFRMIATCSATGVTQSGDTLTTNGLNYLVQFLDRAECCTGTGVAGGGGFEVGPGTGGDIDFAETGDEGAQTLAADAPNFITAPDSVEATE